MIPPRWLRDLAQVVGPPGPAGPPGTNGLNGADGAPGVNGANGTNGLNGTNGTNGVDGAPGADGAAGAPGADGANGADGADGSTVFMSNLWVGPKVTETPGWVTKSYATTGLFAQVEGLVGNATQATGSIDSVFITPSNATAFHTTEAIVLKFIGDSVTSTAVKYRLYVYKEGSTTAVYDSGATQVVASTTAPTTITLAASQLGTYANSTIYTIRIEASVTTSGFYVIGLPAVQVVM